MRANLLPTLVLAACIAGLAAWTVALELEVRDMQAELSTDTPTDTAWTQPVQVDVELEVEPNA